MNPLVAVAAAPLLPYWLLYKAVEWACLQLSD